MAAAASDVQIGYPCDKIKFAQDTDPFLDKIGGTPVWLEKDVLPPAEWAACEACGKPLLLMLQLWAKLPEPGKASRVYYLFACNTRVCMTRPGSWRVLKAIKRTAPVSSTPRNKKARTNATPAAANGTPATPQQTPKKKGSNKKAPSVAAAATTLTPKTPATPASASAFSWDMPSTPFQFGQPSPAFGSPLVFGAPSQPSPSSPSRSALELLAERDKKYAWDEDDEGLDEEEEEEEAEVIEPPRKGPLPLPREAGLSSPPSLSPSNSSAANHAPTHANGLLLLPREAGLSNPPSPSPSNSSAANPNPAHANPLEALTTLPREAGHSNPPSLSPSNSSAANPAPTDALEALTTQFSELRVLPETAATDTEVLAPSTPTPPLQPSATPATPAIGTPASSSSSSKAAWTAAPTFPAYPLEFSAEWTDEDFYEHELRLLAEYNTQDAVEDVPADGVGGWTGEGYEKSRPKYMNKAFKRFQKLVEDDPEQCIRYDLNGQPAFYSNDAVSAALTEAGPPVCTRCGGPRAFEFQLMPMILSLLPIEQLVPRADKDKKGKAAATAAGPGGGAAASNSAAAQTHNFSAFLDRHACGMDWGTVLVYSCAVDCEAPPVPSGGGGGVTVSYSLEYAAVQVESLM
ncbi:programmed cell death protein [Geranomyces variabilis]|nr:programmed cell death protein [Geranomyces variabilis]